MPPPGPPPLKSRPTKGPPPRPSSKARGEGPPPPLKGSKDALKEALAELNASDGSGDEREDGSEGEWLFKADDLVKGPVSASVIVDGIENGELGPETPVAREMGNWFPLPDVPYFNRVLVATTERKEAEAELVRVRAQQRRLFVARLVMMATIAFVPSVAGAAAGYGVMKARPWDTTLDYVDRHPPLVDLPPQPKKPPPTPPPVAKEPDPSDEQVADGQQDATDDEGNTQVASNTTSKPDDDPKRGGRGRRSKSSKRGGKDKGGKDKGAKDRSGKDKGGKDKGGDDKVGKDKGGDDKGGTKVADGSQLRTLNQDQIMGGLKKGYGGFKRCIGKEMKRNPDMPSRITISFSVANNGKAINFKLLERQVRTGPLADCMSSVVGKLTWPKFYGERKYVEFPLNISKNK